VSSEALIVGALVLPCLGALGVSLTGRWPNLRESITLVAAVATFACVAVLIGRVTDGTRPRLELFEMLPGIALAFELEPLGMLYAAVASGLWIPTSLYAIGYMRGHHETNQTRFFTCFALSIFGALGIAFSANLLTLFLFYEFLTLATYPLVTHAGTEQARKAGRVYLGILISTSVGLLLLAIVTTAYLTGTVEFEPGGILAGKVGNDVGAVLLGLYAFGIGKAALMPFHRWLPAAMVAPTPVSALLHAVAVVKAGVFSVLKVVIYIFGLDYLYASGISIWLTYAAAATILTASVIAIRKDNLKARLAYSTVSQLAYIVLGAGVATGAGAIGAAIHIAMHAMGKITLFFCAGAIMVATHKTEVSQMDGLGRRMPFTMGAFLVASLSIIGLPPLGGAWSKWFLTLGAAEADQYVLIGVLLVSSLLSIGYLMPVVGRAFFAVAKPDPHAHGDAHAHGEHAHAHASEGITEAPLLCVVPLCLTAFGCLLLFFFASDLYKLLEPLAEGGLTEIMQQAQRP